MNVNKLARLSSLATYPALEASAWLCLDDVRGIDTNVQAQHQSDAHRLHLKYTRTRSERFIRANGLGEKSHSRFSPP